MRHLQARQLFGLPFALAEWDHWISHEAVAERRIPIDAESEVGPWLEREAAVGRLLPLVIIRDGERHPMHEGVRLLQGDEVLVLEHKQPTGPQRDEFDDLVSAAPVLDIGKPVSLEQFFALTSEELAGHLGRDTNELFRHLWERESAGSTVLSPGLAIPHLMMEGEGEFALLVARCREGVGFADQMEPVTAVFVLAGTPDQRNLHLRALSAISQIVNQPLFLEQWSEAESTADLRDILLRAERRRI